jgi:hypothetical protein
MNFTEAGDLKTVAGFFNEAAGKEGKCLSR